MHSEVRSDERGDGEEGVGVFYERGINLYDIEIFGKRAPQSGARVFIRKEKEGYRSSVRRQERTEAPSPFCARLA